MRTNVFGTANLVDAALVAGVEHLVFISTDKAARPANNLGLTKWLGEQLVLRAAPPGSHWCSVRFGNVVESRQRGADLRPPDRGRRSGDGHRPEDDEVLRRASARPWSSCCRPRRRPAGARRSCSTWASRSGSSSWPADGPALGHRAGDEIAIEFVGAARGEARRGSARSARARATHGAPLDPAGSTRPAPGPVLETGLRDLVDAVASGPPARIRSLPGPGRRGRQRTRAAME